MQTKTFLVTFLNLLMVIFLIDCQSKKNLTDKLLINTQQGITGDLETGFQNPPLFAKPRVFWWWLNSMATRKSITRDLEELKAKGFGGAMIFDAGSSSYTIAKKTAAGPVFGSDAWKELFVHALKEADRLGLEMSLNIQSGWNPGGPTVTPQDALKKVVWAELPVCGPLNFSEKLPLPEGDFYQDIVVQTYRLKKESAPRLMHWEYKSMNRRFGGGGGYPLHILRELNESALTDFDVKHDSLIDLTNHLDETGQLEWSVPAGNWMILRMGSALTGASVSTASDGYEGLSFDHLNTRALENFFRDGVDPLLASAGKYVGKSLKYLHTDSWEMGRTNWTENFRQEFLERRGYDPTPYLAVVTGVIVDNREVSHRFLYDFRKTISDCIADRMYAEFARLTHERGLLLHPESGGPHAAPIDGLKCLGRNDVPMGEFWARSNTHRVSEDHRLFIKQSSCAAHIYGKRFVAGEGPTTIGPQWERAPKDLKSVFDRNFCEGINRFFWHCFTSSPKEFGLPGNEYFAGTHLNPNTTWWEQSKAFIDYLSRTSFLLAHSLFQADVCLYYGDDVPNFVLRKRIRDDLGPGYDYDECNAEVILTRMSVQDNQIMLPDGMYYRLLRLPDREAITLEVLQKIEQLVKEGATIVGPRPVKSTGLQGYPESNRQVAKIADRLWGTSDGKTITMNKYGRGRVFWGKSLREILQEDGIPPDFTYMSSQDSTQLDYIHRKVNDTDIYFVVNRLARQGIYDTQYRYLPDLPDRYEWVDGRFRVTGKVPEIWNPMTGEITEVPVYREEKATTVVSLQLEPEGSRFILFRKTAQKTAIVSFKKVDHPLFPITEQQPTAFPAARLVCENDQLFLEAFETGSYQLTDSEAQTFSLKIEKIAPQVWITGPWEVYFPPDWGAPEKTTFAGLISWTQSDDPGIRYFSGTAEYRNTFELPDTLLINHRLYLDLGNVQELAEVNINGHVLGTLWMPPFQTEISEFVHKGKNVLTVKVVNLWPNRLIGDQFLPENERFTRTNIQKFTKTDPLRVSGLLGPVRIIPAKTVPVSN